MELTLIEKTGQTRIKCSLRDYPRYKGYIEAQIALHGGREERKTSRFVYYIIDADIMGGGGA